jgi:hypothetical protein
MGRLGGGDAIWTVFSLVGMISKTQSPLNPINYDKFGQLFENDD